ncbi:MAG: hypothetical protein F9K13_12070 [Candidatus Methylomirabilis oxygeniifera]|uniref:Uncharacterized protein n=1 Tax=Methylomirabilis oxygeniifera TaxID=671143 RepID=D5MGX7_METO1|nr:MAG: hypothetical protein F9K13_12070 [Candidatus Methylomirabilis oxyfera]CBE69008.1 conserved membrane protein of unknown function [Candidatus Methylomirabilis oxyfera]
MILHPAVIANVVSSLIISVTIVYAAVYGVQILLKWDLQSGDELQLRLERRTYLISTLLSFILVLELTSLFLFVFTADTLCPLFVGAMCAAGTLNVNAFGYPTLLMKMVNFLLAGLWLVLNYADNQAYDYPLIKKKYLLLAVIAPLSVLETFLEGTYFLNLRADVITSCCGSLFSSEQVSGIGSELAALPSRPMMWTFFLGMGGMLLLGLYFYTKGKGGYLYALATWVMFGVSLVSIISFISLYIYELPTHHCPFCIVMKEYGYIGYALYLPLFLGAVTGGGIGTLIPFRRIESLRAVLPALIRKLTIISLAAYATFTAIVIYEIVASNLIL